MNEEVKSNGIKKSTALLGSVVLTIVFGWYREETEKMYVYGSKIIAEITSLSAEQFDFNDTIAYYHFCSKRTCQCQQIRSMHLCYNISINTTDLDLVCGCIVRRKITIDTLICLWCVLIACVVPNCFWLAPSAVSDEKLGKMSGK